MSDDATGAGHPDDLPDGLPRRRVSINQVVAFNMSVYRRAAGMTQDELGERLGGWSFASVSAAERSWDGKRVRQFNADEIMRIAAAVGVPVIAMFLPPPDAGTAVDYVFDFGSDAPAGLAELLRSLAQVYPEHEDQETPAVAAYRERLMALGENAAHIGYDPAAIEVLRRARAEADRALTMARSQVIQVTSEARARAESLERDAQERHRAALGSLVKSRRELEKRVDDLRAFEREYRSRMLAYFEGMIRDLQAGRADSGVFPAVGGDQDREDMRPVPPGGES